jgi:hypothetical protein
MQDDDRRDDRWGGRRDDRWGERDRNRHDDNGGPISNTIEATKEKLGYTKQKAEEEASRLKQKAEETAGIASSRGLPGHVGVSANTSEVGAPTGLS